MILDLTLIIAIGFIGGILAKRLGQPTVAGYLVGGVAGSFFFGAGFEGYEGIDAIAQIGVALLLFTVGIELNFARLRKVIKIAVIGGIAQIAVCTLLYLVMLQFFGMPLFQALFIAAAFSLSSTAVVIKILAERGMLESLGGEIMTAWLLVQDLAVVPLVIILPLLKDGLSPSIFPTLIGPLAGAGLFLFGMIYVGRRIVSFVLEKIASYNVQELLLLATVSICLGIAYLTEQMGLSFILGAFLAGVLISETTENHAIFSEIRPLRDLFTVVFFVSIPLLINPEAIISGLPLALAISIAVMAIKFLVIVGLMYYFGYHHNVSFLVGIGMVQVGEFSFVLVRDGIRQGILTEDAYSLVLSVSVITIVLTPVLFTAAPRWYQRLHSYLRHSHPRLHRLLYQKGADNTLSTEELPLSGHVVLCGFGRMGRYIGRALTSAGIPYVVIEYNRYLVHKLRKANSIVLYGDPSDKEILVRAHVADAKMLIIAIPDLHTQKMIIVNAKKLQESIHIICRTHFEADQKELKESGATTVVQPEFVAALSVVERTLRHYKISDEDIDHKISRLKIEHGAV